ncbi:MAG TPA: DoxX family protein [Aeromicrobium sp.]|nr:DoxX family protein [Aeromicrobium sp.]
MTSITLLIARFGLGIVFIAHGWQKLHTTGLAGVAAVYRRAGVPMPEIAAYYSTFAELIAGIALLLGAFTAVAGLLLFVNMFASLAIVHIDKGVFVNQGGFELVLALGIGALLLAVIGAGAYSIDEFIGHRIGWAAALDPDVLVV